MAPNRWVVHLLLAVGLPTLPACVIHGGTTHNEPPTAPAPRGPTDFGMYPRAPGERVALHPLGKAETVAAEPRPPADPPIPPESPGTLPVAVTQPADPPLVQIVRAFLDNRPDVAREHINKLDPANQELMLQLLPVVVRVWQTSLAKASPTEVGVLAKQLDEAAAVLASKAPLMIEKACFCEEIKSFGHYEPLPERNVFRPGKLVSLYTEVRNIPSEPAADPIKGEGYLTRLACTLELRDADGNVIKLTDRNRKQVPKVQELKTDFSRSPLRDYCLLSYFETPSKPGTYTVTFEVRDPQSGCAVSKPMTFRVQ